MTAHFEAKSEFASPDALGAAASYIEREYGGHGYRLAIAASDSKVTVFEVSHFDGSRFNVVADKWGNVRRIPDDVSYQEALQRVKDMAHAASVA